MKEWSKRGGQQSNQPKSEYHELVERKSQGLMLDLRDAGLSVFEFCCDR